MAEANENRFEIRNGYAIIIDNRNFSTPEGGVRERRGAERDKHILTAFCKEAGLRIQPRDEDIPKTDNLTLAETRDLLRFISQKNFDPNPDSIRYDAFVAFISSFGYKGELYTVDGGKITIKEIVATVEKNRSLEGKPKIFFVNNCLDQEIDDSQPTPPKGKKVEDGKTADESDDAEPLYVPMVYDVFIGYASVDGFEYPRHEEHGSWAAIELKKALETHAFDMSLTELLAKVGKNGSEFNHPSGKKQVACYVSTLTKTVHFLPGPPPQPPPPPSLD